MPNEKREIEAPPAVIFTDRMTGAIIESSKKYLKNYNFVLIGYSLNKDNPGLVEMGCGTTLRKDEIKRLLKMFLELLDTEPDASGVMQFVDRRKPNED